MDLCGFIYSGELMCGVGMRSRMLCRMGGFFSFSTKECLIL